MDDEPGEMAIGISTPVIARVHMPAPLSEPRLITTRCYEITARKKRMNTDLPLFVDVHETCAVPFRAKPIEDAARGSVHEASADASFLSGFLVLKTYLKENSRHHWREIIPWHGLDSTSHKNSSNNNYYTPKTVQGGINVRNGKVVLICCGN